MESKWLSHGSENEGLKLHSGQGGTANQPPVSQMLLHGLCLWFSIYIFLLNMSHSITMNDNDKVKLIKYGAL